MGILQLPMPLPAQIGILPATKKMVTTDNLATVTTAGYLNAVNLESYPLAQTDTIECLYSFNTTTNAGTYARFSVAIANGVITLAQIAASNAVIFSGAVVSGDVPAFSGTTGTVTDSGILATNIVTKNSINTMASGSDIVLAKGTGTATAGAVTINQQSGVITTVALTTAAGSAATVTLTNSFIAATSVVLVSVMGGTNTTTAINVSATAGTGTSTITIANNAATAALNGTVILGFAVF